MSKRITTEQFIEEAKKIHGDKYDYVKVVYINKHTKVCIICPIHGEFWQTPNNHLQGHGCPYCTKRFGYNKATFAEKAKKVHNNKYNYSKIDYVNNKTKICVICSKHGEFLVRPDHHLQGEGCPKCANEIRCKNQRFTTQEFVKKANEIHADKYDYSNVSYKNNSTKVSIICPIHGKFWQRPADHLKGCGCWKCKQSSLEKDILDILYRNNIDYEYNSFPKFLNGLQLDFYLPNYGVGIECQGIQHFIENHFFEPIEVVKERDERKRKLCEEHGIKLLYYSNLGIKYPYEVFENKEKILEEIKKYGND